jgi:hypothetical protein
LQRLHELDTSQWETILLRASVWWTIRDSDNTPGGASGAFLAWERFIRESASNPNIIQVVANYSGAILEPHLVAVSQANPESYDPNDPSTKDLFGKFKVWVVLVGVAFATQAHRNPNFSDFYQPFARGIPYESVVSPPTS